MNGPPRRITVAAKTASWLPSPAEVAPVCFECLLDNQPAYTVPPRSLRTLHVVEPSARIVPSFQLADALTRAGRAELAPGTVALVDDPLYGRLPFWLGSMGLNIVQALRDGRIKVADLTAEWAWRLSAAGVIRTLHSAKLEIEQRDTLIEKAKTQFALHGYTPLPTVLHPFYLGELRLHLRRLVRLGYMTHGDGQSPLRWVRHNDPGLRLAHAALTATVSAVVGEAVKPSYVYAAVYHDGADLPTHRDRSQCEYTVSVCVDCVPDPYREVPWPIVLETSAGRVQVYQALGDGLLFKGTQITHGRPELAAGLSVASGFFHYVPEAFEGSLS
jgi:hypothetical protein